MDEPEDRMTTSGLRIEMELDRYNELRALVKELLEALNCYFDSKDDPAIDELLARARKAVTP